MLVTDQITSTMHNSHQEGNCDERDELHEIANKWSEFTARWSDPSDSASTSFLIAEHSDKQIHALRLAPHLCTAIQQYTERTQLLLIEGHLTLQLFTLDAHGFVHACTKLSLEPMQYCTLSPKTIWQLSNDHVQLATCLQVNRSSDQYPYHYRCYRDVLDYVI